MERRLSVRRQDSRNASPTPIRVGVLLPRPLDLPLLTEVPTARYIQRFATVSTYANHRSTSAYTAIARKNCTLQQGCGSTTLQPAVAVVCWSGICGLGSIEEDAFGPINTLPLDHKSGSPESQFGPLPDINKPPLGTLVGKLKTRPSRGCTVFAALL
jgi:hypothetical protein